MSIEPWPENKWPSWLESFRPFQIDKINEIIEAFRQTDLVILSGPTGSGKTLIGDAVAELMSLPAYYLSETKLLQTQFIRDFGDVGARKIWGRSNFTPLISTDYYGNPVTCKDCTRSGDSCKWCPEVDDCPYTVDKQQAEQSKIAVANYAYALNEWRSPFSAFHRALTICDECDVLEGQLMNIVTVEMSESLRREIKVTQPRVLSDPHSQKDWLDTLAIPRLQDHINRMRTGDDVKLMRRKRFLQELAGKLQHVSDNLLIGDWVLTGYEKDRRRNVDKRGPLIWKPIKVDEYGPELLWRHSHKWLLMSASVISAENMVQYLGYEKDYAYIEAPMPFERKNRRIIYAPVAQMTMKEMDNSLPKVLDAVVSILDQYPEYRTIIHSVSYVLARRLAERLTPHLKLQDRETFLYSTSDEREEVIETFKQTDGAVLIGPSFTRGFDFKGEDAQVNIVVKMPQASLGDDQIAQRLYNHGEEGKEWYNTNTIRELVQMTGRTTRTETDWSVSFILDSQLSRIRGNYPKLLPNWWEEALTVVKTTQVDNIRKGFLER